MTQNIRLIHGWGRIFDWTPEEKWQHLQEIMTENTNTRLVLFGATEHDHVFNCFDQLCESDQQGFPDLKPILNKLAELKRLSGNTLEWVTGANQIHGQPITHIQRIDPEYTMLKTHTFVDNPVMYDRVYHYGTFWLNYGFNGILEVDKKTGQIQSPILVKQVNQPIEHLFICKNAHPHHHRCAMLDALALHDLIEPNLVTFASNHMEHTDWTQSLGYDWNTWTPESLSIEHTKEDQWYGVPTQYAKTWLEIVCESSVKAEFFTEKTVKPLLYEKPFVILGPPGMNATLKKWGFKLYDEIFDYEFDNISDYRVRALHIAQQLADWQQELNKQPQRVYDLKKRMVQKTRYNLIHFLELVLEDKHIDPDLREILNCLPNEQNYDHQQLINVHDNLKNGRRLANIILKTIRSRAR